MFLPFPSIAKSLIRWTERLQSLLPRLWLGNQILQAYYFVNLDVAGSAVGNKNILKVSNEVPNQKTPTPADTTFLSQCGSHRPKASEQPNQTTKTTTVWITSATAEFADDLFNSFLTKTTPPPPTSQSSKPTYKCFLCITIITTIKTYL